MTYTIEQLTDITPHAESFVRMIRSLRPDVGRMSEIFVQTDLAADIRATCITQPDGTCETRDHRRSLRPAADLPWARRVFWIDGLIPVFVDVQIPILPNPDQSPDPYKEMRSVLAGQVSITIHPLTYGMRFSDLGGIALRGCDLPRHDQKHTLVEGLCIPLPVWYAAVSAEQEAQAIGDAVAAALCPEALAFELAVLRMLASRAYDIQNTDSVSPIPSEIHLHLNASISYRESPNGPIRYRHLLRNRGSAKHPKPDMSDALHRAYSLRTSKYGVGIMPTLTRMRDVSIFLPSNASRPSAHHMVAERMQIMRMFETAGYSLQRWI